MAQSTQRARPGLRKNEETPTTNVPRIAATPASTEHLQRRALPRAAAFWLVAGVFFMLIFAGATPPPLYRVYQAEWGFSATMLTAVFAVYAYVLLATLLFSGRCLTTWAVDG